MKLSMIVAMGRENVIGRNNKMPWNLPADLRYFKEVTMGHAIVYGRKTLESMNGPLPGRRNIVLTRNKDFIYEGCETAHSVEAVLKMLEGSEEEVFVIGGEEIYKLFLPHANKLYITSIDEYFAGADTHFPEFSSDEWTLISQKEGLTNEENPYKYCFKVFTKS